MLREPDIFGEQLRFYYVLCADGVLLTPHQTMATRFYDRHDAYSALSYDLHDRSAVVVRVYPRGNR